MTCLHLRTGTGIHGRALSKGSTPLVKPALERVDIVHARHVHPMPDARNPSLPADGSVRA